MTLHIPAAMLDKLWPDAPSALKRAMVEQSNGVFSAAGMKTRRHLEHFMAQISHECDGGTIVRESMRYSAPRIMQIFGVGKHSAKVTDREARALAADAKKTGGVALAERVYGLGNSRKAHELGNIEDGDGWKYRGGGLIQETGRDAYEKASRVSGVDLIADPDKIASPAYALRIAVSAFATPRILAACDRDDIVAVTRAVNGGTNGLTDRQGWLARWRRALVNIDLDGDEIPHEGDRSSLVGVLSVGSTGWDVEALQRRLSELGYAVGKVDGKFGGQTRSAVMDFQARNGLPATGEVDAATRAALGSAPPKEVSTARSEATADDLREAGSTTVAAADKVGLIGKAAAALGIGGTASAGADATGLSDTIKSATDQVGAIKDLGASLASLGHWALAHWWIIALAAGIAAWWFGRDIIAARLADHRSGAHLGR